MFGVQQAPRSQSSRPGRSLGRFVASIIGLTAGTAFVAAAMSLTMTSGTLGASTVASSRCVASGLSVIQTLTVSAVSSVSVGVLPAACGGGILRVAVHNGATSSEGSAAIPAGGGTVTVTLSAAVPVTLAEQTDLVVSGP